MNNGTLRTLHGESNTKQIFKQPIPYWWMAGEFEFETIFTASVWEMSMKRKQ